MRWKVLIDGRFAGIIETARGSWACAYWQWFAQGRNFDIYLELMA
jgi:hypothetical protein